MSHQLVFVAALLAAAPALIAQEQPKKPAPAAPQEMANPKTKEHDALKDFAGTWDNTVKTEAMPGVPGMEKASETKGTERAELICNGLFLKSTVHGTFNGQPFEGLWVAGYDPFKKVYTSVWVDSNEGCMCTSTGTRDAAKKTWEFSGETPQGPMRSQVTFTGADTFTEKCFTKSPEGKEIAMMEVSRQRAKGAVAAPVEAAAKIAKPASKELEELHKSIGEWDAIVRYKMSPDAQWTEEKGTEKVTAICGGKWLWSDFRGQMMGQPFEGHALIGYDQNKKQYVSWWIDSMGPAGMTSAGTFDAAKKGVVMTGSSICQDGSPMTSKEIHAWKDANTRVSTMEFQGKEGTMTMEITYKRK